VPPSEITYTTVQTAVVHCLTARRAAFVQDFVPTGAKAIASTGCISYNGPVMNTSRTRSYGHDIISLRLGGWSGRALLSDSRGQEFSAAEWADSLTKPEMLLENSDGILKDDGPACVAVTDLTVANRTLRVVVKRHRPQPGVRSFFRCLRPGRALRNLKTALKLMNFGIPVALPLAAVQNKRGLRATQSIYITEYIDDSTNLYNFAVDRLSGLSPGNLATRTQLARQLAAILAELHKNGFRHRDAKATNFLVSTDSNGRLSVRLVDMDGIKRYLICRRHRRLRCLWQLAASLMSVASVNRTDYLRTFTFYCNLTDVDATERRKLYREIAKLARAKFERKTAETASGD